MAASEPFRVFFPLGILAAIIGSLLWPAFHAGWLKIYPAIQHPRLMIFGFGAAFVSGFLGTAWPKFIGSRPLTLTELSFLVSSWSVAQCFYVIGAVQPGDFAFATHEILLMGMLGFRLRGAEDWPPPGFILAFLSLAGAATSALIFCFASASISPRIDVLLRLIAYEGALLLPLIGVGSFLFPRVFFAGTPRIPPGLTPSARSRKMGIWGGAGLILVSFVLEAWGRVQTGNLVRFGALYFWAWFAFPSAFRGTCPSTRAWALRSAITAIAACFLLRGFWPGPGFGLEHLLFIGGFGLTIPLIADRVILGHCAASPVVSPTSRSWRWIVWLLCLAFVTRASADLFPATLASHQVYASIVFVAVLIIWIGIHRKHFHKVSPH